VDAIGYQELTKTLYNIPEPSKNAELCDTAPSSFVQITDVSKEISSSIFWVKEQAKQVY
jgi:hypothetical protein